MSESSTINFRCPLCHGSLKESPGDAVVKRQRFECALGHTYSGHDGIIDFLPHELLENSPEKRLESESHDVNVLDVFADFTVTDKNLYSWLNYYQLFEVASCIQQMQPRSILVGMCGSGFEFDVLQQFTTEIWGVDISMGVLGNAKRRADSLGLLGGIIRGDIENLPFADSSFDLVIVHHGLHHMPLLDGALRDLLRVSRKHVLISEPVDGWPRRLARFTRASPGMEPGGTVVRDIDSRKVAEIATKMNAVLEWEKRYFYPRVRSPQPGTFIRFANRMGLSLWLRWPLRAFNSIFGRFLGLKATFLLAKKPHHLVK